MTKHQQLRRTLEELKRCTAPRTLYAQWLDQALVIAAQIEEETEKLRVEHKAEIEALKEDAAYEAKERDWYQP